MSFNLFTFLKSHYVFYPLFFNLHVQNLVNINISGTLHIVDILDYTFFGEDIETILLWGLWTAIHNSVINENTGSLVNEVPGEKKTQVKSTVFTQIWRELPLMRIKDGS